MRKPDDRSVGRLSPLEVMGIVFGVRYEPQWRLVDSMGSLVDRFLRTGGTSFGPKTFPSSLKGVEEHILLNQETGDRLLVNQQDTILEMSLATRDLGQVTKLGANFESIVVEGLQEVGRVRDVLRYGVVFRLDECHALLETTPIQHYLRPDFENARTLDLRFTRRLPSLEAQAKKGVNDYRNVIYMVQQNDKGQVSLSVDYQEYFIPPLSLEEFNDRSFDRFVERGVEYFQGEFTKWFKKLTGDQEAA